MLPAIHVAMTETAVINHSLQCIEPLLWLQIVQRLLDAFSSLNKHPKRGKPRGQLIIITISISSNRTIIDRFTGSFKSMFDEMFEIMPDSTIHSAHSQQVTGLVWRLSVKCHAITRDCIRLSSDFHKVRFRSSPVFQRIRIRRLEASPDLVLNFTVRYVLTVLSR